MRGDISYTINVSENKAMNILNELKNLEGAIKNGDTYRALKIASMLKEDGVFRDNVIFDLIRNHGEDNIAPYSDINDTNFMLKNLMCFVVGYGDALFAYPMDILAIFFYTIGGVDAASGMLIGFSGIVVNIFLLPKNDREMSAPFFCLGTSIMAYAVNE